ncbi:hypothetical protein [Proteus terrae]|uniref:hypothetical protein n=1 Tax=Proteus terrae TaxID=1574161 RepID=UPI000D698C4C|nr:hypothetical protein [Proteus terrae]
MNWLIPSNNEVYNHIEAFKHLKIIDWTQLNNKFEIGDKVFIYASLPIQRITHVCVVDQINIDAKNKITDNEFWTSSDALNESKKGKYIRLRLLAELHLKNLDIKSLEKNGLKGAPQGRQKLKDNLLKYIENEMEI